MKYDIEFLKEKGFFKEEMSQTYNIPDLLDDTNISYKYDSINRLVYFENICRENIAPIIKHLKGKKNYVYYWFCEDNRIYCYRTFGENKEFLYNAKHTMGAEWIKGKRQKLREFSSTNIDMLFELKEVVDYFYKQLWLLRIKIAEAIVTPLDENQKIMAAQRIIDRLIFIYFLAEKEIIRLINRKGRVLRVNANAVFEHLISEQDDFYVTLNKIFFDYLNNQNNNDLYIEGSSGHSLHIPYLNGGLFKEKEIKYGGKIFKESAMEICGFDWKDLIDKLNEYNWIIEEFNPDLVEQNVVGKLTPEVLGHIYEKFVITVSALEDIQIEDLRVNQSGEVELINGNKDIGAYYTPEDVSNYITSNTIYYYLKNKLKVENETFEAFYDEYKNNNQMLQKADKFLYKIKVLDPAVGSGHFLMNAADIIANWREKCNPNINSYDYDVRKHIITNNLYGVDIMEGAAEVCKLRLWLWLIAAQKQGQDCEPLPNIDFNIRIGNSLIGFIEEDFLVNARDSIMSHELKKELQEYNEKIFQYRGEKNSQEKLKNKLTQLNDSMQKKLNNLYHRTLNCSITETTDELEEAFKILRKCNSSYMQLKLEYKEDMTEHQIEKLSSLGFKTYRKSARLKFKPGLYDDKKIRQYLNINDNLYSYTIIRNVLIEDIEKLIPFHWIMEFPDIFYQFENKGFDIVIGNPPYGRDVLSDVEKSILSGMKSAGCGDICGYFLEREIELTKIEGHVNNVIAGNVAFSDRMTPIRDLLRTSGKFTIAYFGTRPSRIFDSVEKRVAIVSGKKDNIGSPIYTSHNIRFTQEMRKTLFDNLTFTSTEDLLLGNRIGQRLDNESTKLPKIGNQLLKNVLFKLKNVSDNYKIIREVITNEKGNTNILYIRGSAGYWINALKKFPYTSSKIIKVPFINGLYRNYGVLAFNSSLFYLFWVVYGNNRDLTKGLFEKFPVPEVNSLKIYEEEITSIATVLEDSMHSCFEPDKGQVGEFNTGECKKVIDQADEILSKLFNLNKHELKYVKEYDSHIRIDLTNK
ncbi:MAG: Eco57I restriction-modification methylase domain-containing protein [bacterium]